MLQSEEAYFSQKHCLKNNEEVIFQTRLTQSIAFLLSFIGS